MAVDYNSNAILNCPCNKKARTGALPSCKHEDKINTHKYGLIQSYCVIFNRSIINERTYMLHSDEIRFGKRSEQESLNEVLGVNKCNRYASYKQLKMV